MRSTRVIPVLVLALVLASGCSVIRQLPLPGLGGDTSTPTPVAAPPADPAVPPDALTSPPAFPSAPVLAEPAPSGLATPPGTVIRFGERAMVDAEYGTKQKGLISIAVTGIERGARADLDKLKLGDQAAGYTPYYIRSTVTNLSDTDFSFASLTSGNIKGQLGDGTAATPLRVIGTYRPCASTYAPANFLRSATYRSCEVFLAPTGTVVDKAAFTGVGYNQVFYDDPIVWSGR